MVKVISLSNDAYARLKILKGTDKSFSDVVIEFTDEMKAKKKNIEDFFGIWKDNKEEVKKMKKLIEEDRKKFKLKEVEL